MRKKLIRITAFVLAFGLCRLAVSLPQEAETVMAQKDSEDQITKIKDQINNAKDERNALTSQKSDLVKSLTAQMREASRNLEFERAAELRDVILKLEEQL